MTYLVGNYSIKYVGPINMIRFYQLIHDWFVENEFVETTKGEEFPEIFYSDSRSQPHGREIWIWWRFAYAPESNPFYQYIIRLSFHTFKMNEQEVVVGNKREKLQNGEHQIILTAILETDYKGTFRSHPILKYFYETFVGRIMYGDLEKRKEMLKRKAEDIQDKVKAFFNAPHFHDHGRPFHPKQGLRENHQVGA